MTKTYRRTVQFKVDRSEMVGARLCCEAYIARTGIQVYETPEGTIREYRPPEEVFSGASIASMKGMPITVQHPEGMVTPGNWSNLSVGTTGDNIKPAEDNVHLLGNLYIQETEAIKRVEAEDLCELSVGYISEVDHTPGTTPGGEPYDAIQKNIRGNHVALLEKGQARGGPTVAIRLDSEGHETLHSVKLKEETQTMTSIKFDGLEVEVEEPVAKAIEAERDENQEGMSALQKEKDALEGELGLAKEELESVKADLAEAVQGEVARQKEILIVEANKFGDLEIQEDAEPLDIKRLALETLGVDLEGKTDEYVEVRYEVELEKLEKEEGLPENLPVEAPAKMDSVRAITNPHTVNQDNLALVSIDAAARL